MTNTHRDNPFWDFAVVIIWICTRYPDRAKDVSDMDQPDRVACAMSQLKPPFFWIEPAPEVNEAIAMEPGAAQQELLKKLAGRIRISATKIGSNNERVEVAPAELYGLEFYIQADYGPPIIGLYRRSDNCLIWRDLLFWRSDIMRTWPAQSSLEARKRKTAAVSHAILAYLRAITSPDAPLTKPAAKKRCLAEVPHAYPAAFEKAWKELDSSHKKKRGQHGPGSH